MITDLIDYLIEINPKSDIDSLIHIDCIPEMFDKRFLDECKAKANDLQLPTPNFQLAARYALAILRIVVYYGNDFDPIDIARSMSFDTEHFHQIIEFLLNICPWTTCISFCQKMTKILKKKLEERFWGRRN